MIPESISANFDGLSIEDTKFYENWSVYLIEFDAGYINTIFLMSYSRSNSVLLRSKFINSKKKRH